MTNLRKRTSAIQQLAGRLATEAPALIDCLVSDFGLARGAAPRHVEESLAYLLAWGADDCSAVSPAIRSGERRASGSVAIVLHPDAPLTSFTRTVPAAFIAGATQIVVNVPHTASATRDALVRICQGLPGVAIEAERTGSFLCRAMTDAYTRAIWAGGAADLLAPFEALIQDSRSHVIFEGPGNDAIVVGEHADVRRAAEQVARLAFRDGGRDPAAPARVYVAESQEADFCEALRAVAASISLAPSTDGRCTISPLRGASDRDTIQELLEAATQAGASVAGGRDLRTLLDEAAPTPRPTVVTGCAPTLRLVAERCPGPVLPVVAFQDAEDLLAALDQTAGIDGQVGCAVSVMGADDLVDALARRFAYVFDAAGPYAPQAREARLRWGGGPSAWTLDAGADGLCRQYGPVDLTLAFSREGLTSRARWLRRAQHAVAAR